ncbi:PBECR2 nuclease fold domain-containing protein, partial [Campylobacter upsaliensis]
TKETQKAWLEAFNLKSLEEAYIPNFKAEVKEAINRVLGGEEIKLTKGSLIKLIKEKRLKYLDRIKPTLENPHSVILQNDGALIFARDYGEEKYFTSVARNDSGEWIIRSNAPKSKNGLNNKILNGGKEIYNDQAASQINASNPYDDIANSNIKLDNESIAQNADYLELVKEYGEENAKGIIKQKILGENIAQVLENEEEKFIYKKGDREFEFKIKDAMGQFEMQYDELNLKSDLNKSFLKALNKLKIGYEVLENEPVRIRYFKQEAKERKPKETKPSANKTLGQIQKDMSARLKELKAQAKENYERYKNEDKALQKELTNTKDLFKAFEKEFNETKGTILISRAKRRKNDAEGKVETSVFLGNELALRNALDRWERYSGYSEENALEVKERLELLRSYVKRLEKHREDIKAKREQLEQDYQQNEAARSKEMGVIGNYNILSNLKGVSENELYEPFLEKIHGFLSKADFYERHLPFIREEFQKLFNITPLKEFGTNYAEFYRDGKEAVDKLLSEKRGQVKGAFYKEGLGEIDLVWGDSKKGLSHILERRKEDFIKQGLDENEALERALEFVKKIPQIIEQGEVKVGVNRAFVDTKDDRALIALDYKGKDKKWVITAYKMDDPSQADTHLTRLNTSTSSVSRASVVNESIAQNEHNAVAWDEFEAFKDKDDILKANLKGEQNSAKENEAKRQANEYESLNAIQQERGGGLFTNEELNRGQSRHARGNERDGVGVSKVDGSKSQTLFSEGDFENSRTRSGGNGGRGYTAGEENALSIRVEHSRSGEVLNADENYIRENNPRYNDTKRPREDNIIEPKRSLHMGANKTNGGANDRSILLKPQWSEALEKQGLFTSFAKAHKRSEKFTFTDTSDANKILEDNFQALEGLKYVIKSGFDNNVRSQNLQSLQNFRGFGKGTNALLKLRGEEKEKWAKLLKELTDLTGEKITITDLVKRSADAYYTPDVIIGKMANLTEFFAKEAGEDLAKLIKLEPSAGIGRFLNAFELSNFYAVEKDALSANIAKALYEKGGAIINNAAYEKSPLKINNTFDLVIGNPPYANFKIGDDEFRENIHNYFMKKNIDVLKPNGLSLQIITHNFLDAQSDYTRKVMAKDAVFLGAVRLANNVFKDASVTTDIIAFRKKAPDEMDKEFNTSWVESVEYEGAYLNKYFLENPQNVIGKMEVVKNQFGGKTIAVKPNGFDIENLNLSNYIKNDKLFKRVEGYIDNKLLSKAVQRIEEKEKGVSFFGSARSGELRFDKESDKFLVLDDQQNTHDFNIYERISEAKPNWQESSINNRVEALKEMMPQIEKLKKALFDLKEAELNPNSSDEKIEILRRILNKAYDELHGKNGSFRNARGKISQKWELYDILDDTSFELFALEKKAIVEERGDKKIVIGSEKSEIFHKRLVKPYEAPTSANNINEALQISKAEYGKIDLVRMSELLSKDMSEVENELLEQKRIYKDHLGGNVEKDEFLSGNVREKIARFYDENGSLNLSSDEKIRAFQMQSLEDLKAIVPDDIELPFINIPLGATWLDKEILREFFAKELEIGEVNFKRAGNRWYLLGKFNGSLEITTSEDYLRDTGIKAINAVDYILKMMNNESLIFALSFRSIIYRLCAFSLKFHAFCMSLSSMLVRLFCR